MHIEVTENYWQYTSTTVPETTKADIQTTIVSKAPLILGSACGALALGVAFLIFRLVIIKKK